MRILPKTISEQEFLEGLKKVKRQKLKLAFMLGFLWQSFGRSFGG